MASLQGNIWEDKVGQAKACYMIAEEVFMTEWCRGGICVCVCVEYELKTLL